MMGRGGEIILDTNGITQVGAYQHQPHYRSYLRQADRKFDIGWRKLDIFSLEISEWTIMIEFEFLLSLWFSSCCSCCWKLQHQHYIHSTSYILCWSLNILPVISASKIANTEVPALSNARSETSVRVACCCAAVVLLCCCGTAPTAASKIVAFCPRWAEVGEADKYKYCRTSLCL